MKMLFTQLAFMSMVMISAFANMDNTDRERFWVTDSYEYGKSGNSCEDILYNYGTQNFTFSSEDPDLLEILFKACKKGVSDKKTGQNSLPGLLNKLPK